MDAPDTALRRSIAETPRVSIGVSESPVETWPFPDGNLLVKRDDLNAPRMGGNKVRALQFLLAEVPSGRSILTVGGVGSTHVLSTAVHAASLGIPTNACRWPHAEHAVSKRVARECVATCRDSTLYSGAALAWLAAGWQRWRPDLHWIPFGGTSPLGVLGHVEGAYELASQVERGLLPEPQRVYVALGTGGTAAGLALGFASAGMSTQVIAVRCGPTFGHEMAWMGSLIRRVVVRHGSLSSVGKRAMRQLEVSHAAWSGAYALPLPEAQRLADTVEGSRGVLLDATYSAKACYVAGRSLQDGTGDALFWNTFDARWMAEAGSNPLVP